jgi:hypothetical protein
MMFFEPCSWNLVALMPKSYDSNLRLRGFGFTCKPPKNIITMTTITALPFIIDEWRDNGEEREGVELEGTRISRTLNLA